MGCDGGTIPTRDELVKTKKKEEKVSKEDALNTKWRNCALSQAPLEKPVVACQLGRLFSKESLLEFLIAKESHSSYNTFSYIRNLKDIKDVGLTDNPAYKGGVNKVGVVQGVPFICPVTGIEMNGNYKFVFLWACGCVMSERALREIKATDCPCCNTAFSGDDVIVLNGNEADVDHLTHTMQARKLLKKKRKKTDSGLPCKRQCAHPSQENFVEEVKDAQVSSSKLPSSSSSSKSISSEIIEEYSKSKVQNSKDDSKHLKLYKSKLLLAK